MGLVVGVTADRRADEQQELLRRRGARPVHAPTIRTLSLAGEEVLRAATEELIDAPPDIVVLTTGLGVRSWVEAADSMGLGAALADAFEEATVLTRGPKANGAAVTAGWHVDWIAPDATSAELVEQLRAMDVSGQRVAVQLDGRAEPVLAQQVAALGAEVVAVPIYRWELPADPEPALRLVDAVCEGAVDAVTFTSAPAVWNLVELAEAAGQLDALRSQLSGPVLSVCVGHVCDAASQKAGFTNTVVPERPRLGPMVQTLSRHVAGSRTPMRVGSREVLLAASAVVVDDQVVELTRREREVLALLMRHPGAVVDKAQMRQVVWGGAVNDHAVEVTVGRLRRRLDGVLRVETVPRRGYRITA